tara:strand:+ start:2598 stop:3005 length:408 start_codon:yes stop_codon:yes gene_type:complete
MSEIYSETVFLPFEISNKNNGQGRSWHGSAKDRKRFEFEIRSLGLVRTPYLFPVSVHVVRVLGKGQRFWDSSSVLRGNYKQLEDALVACGWFTDDSMTFIKRTSSDQDSTRRDQGPAVELTITEAGAFEQEGGRK